MNRDGNGKVEKGSDQIVMQGVRITLEMIYIIVYHISDLKKDASFNSHFVVKIFVFV